MAMAEHDDLDDILDSALEDFCNADGLVPHQSPSDASRSSSTSLGASVETTLGRGLGVALPALVPGRRKTASTKGKSATYTGKTPFASRAQGAAASDAATDNRLSDTLEELTQQTRQTLEQLNTAGDDEAMGERLVESIVKQFEALGGSSQDMQSIMDTVMQQLLSKDILHEPMKEIGERYPKWLDANKLKLSKDDYSRYSRQSELIKQLCLVYETTPDDFPRIVDIMQHMQECGQPPSDIVQEIAPGLELGADGVPMFSELLQESVSGSGQNQNCHVM